MSQFIARVLLDLCVKVQIATSATIDNGLIGVKQVLSHVITDPYRSLDLSMRYDTACF